MLRNFGQKSLDEVKQRLQAAGFKYGTEEPEAAPELAKAEGGTKASAEATEAEPETEAAKSEEQK